MDKMARKNELVTWARPPIPEFNLIERTLGTMIHDAVFRGRRRDKPCGMQKT
jgi:multiple sugar transport system substrate-binding protein